MKSLVRLTPTGSVAYTCRQHDVGDGLGVRCGWNAGRRQHLLAVEGVSARTESVSCLIDAVTATDWSTSVQQVQCLQTAVSLVGLRAAAVGLRTPRVPLLRVAATHLHGQDRGYTRR